MKRYFSLILLFCNHYVFGQDHLQQAIDSLARNYLHSYTGALVIGIYDNSKEKIFYYGETEKGNHQLPDSNSIFEIGGITETFTSVLFADLIIKGAVSVDDPLKNYLPADVPSPVYQAMLCKPVKDNTSENLQPAKVVELTKIFFTPYVCTPDSSSRPQSILLCFLSTHTAGLPEYPDNMKWKKNRENPFNGYTKEMLYDFLRAYNAERPIGFDYKHSDLGIALLGLALSLKMNESYDSLLAEHIFMPLDMTDTRIHLNETQQKHLLNGHDVEGNVVPYWTYDVMAPAGAEHSCISDMMKFISVNISKSKNSFSDVLDFTHNPRIKLINEKPNDMEIALGWKVTPSGTEGKNIVWQSGITGGFSSYIGFIKANHTGVVILSSVSEDVSEMGEQIIKILEKEKL